MSTVWPGGGQKLQSLLPCKLLYVQLKQLLQTVSSIYNSGWNPKIQKEIWENIVSHKLQTLHCKLLYVQFKLMLQAASTIYNPGWLYKFAWFLRAQEHLGTPLCFQPGLFTSKFLRLYVLFKYDPWWPRMTDYGLGWHTRGQGGTRGPRGGPRGARGVQGTPGAKKSDKTAK